MSQFRIEEKISESGSTSVFRAFQEALDRPVLLKVLHQHLANDPVVRERFAREAKACARIRSEHIVQVYDLTEYNGCPAIVMEYIHGRSLKDVIANTPHDPAQLARNTATAILRALSVAHRHGIVHRDIKPGNILVADDGTIKLTDFGLAYIAHSPTVTMEGTVLGTPAYMAPEQIRGENTDARTDFFALGVTLVETFTGKRIFEGSTYSECVRKIMEFRAGHLDSLMDAVPAAYVAFLKKLMDPDPNARYQSASDALKDLGERDEEPAAEVLSGRQKAAIPILMVVALAVLAGAVYIVSHGPGQSGMPSDSTRGQNIAQDTKDSSTTGMQQPERIAARDEKSGRSDAGKETQKSSVERSIPPVDPARDSIQVRFTSNPWAKIYVDGKFIGETPLAQPVALSGGKHSVTFTNPTFEPIMKSITVRPGANQVVSADFLENAGYLMCTVKPWADIYVDEQFKDTTPLSRPIILSEGSHRIRLHNSAFSDTIQVVTIRVRDTIAISVTLRSLR